MSESSAIICGEHGEWVINGTLMRLICLSKELDTTGSDQPLSSPLHYDPQSTRSMDAELTELTYAVLILWGTWPCAQSYQLGMSQNKGTMGYPLGQINGCSV